MRISISKSNIVLYGLLILSGFFFVFQAYGKSLEGLFLFNPSAGVIPFQVDASKTGRVDNLNADRVDDLHAADLMAAGSGGGAYTAYGIDTCAPGWTVAYTGVAMGGMVISGNAFVGGSTVCKQGVIFTSPSFRSLFWITAPGASHDGSVSCAVCVK